MGLSNQAARFSDFLMAIVVGSICSQIFFKNQLIESRLLDSICVSLGLVELAVISVLI